MVRVPVHPRCCLVYLGRLGKLHSTPHVLTFWAPGFRDQHLVIRHRTVKGFNAQAPERSQRLKSVAMGSTSAVSDTQRKLECKVALITGGASGIGECTARLFCKHGASVVVADIQVNLGIALCDQLGAVASFVHCDVTSEEDVSNAVDHAVAKFGKLDIMFNNAGIGGPPCHSIIECTKAAFDRVLAVDLVGVFLGTKHAARVMIPARSGCIIATASVASAVAGAASHAYTCAKRAVAGLTENAAAELGQYGIRVNCVSPAAAVTPLATQYIGLEGEAFEALMEQVGNLKGVRLKVEDVANAVLFLASDDGRFVSGHNLLLDGGLSVMNPSFGVFRAN